MELNFRIPLKEAKVSIRKEATRMKRKQFFGWSALFLSTVISIFWAIWGTIENFHEGWFHPTWQENVKLMLIQYLGFMLLSIAFTVVAVLLPKLGGALYVVMGAAFSYWIYSTRPVLNWEIILAWLPLTAPLVLIGIFFFFGEPKPKKAAYLLAIGLPLVVCLSLSIGPLRRISRRDFDGNYGERLVKGNGIEAIWAPQGPGWPKNSVDWAEAKRRCIYLTEDGKNLATTPQNIWHLPTVDELVRSVSRRGMNCSGTWDPDKKEASYKIPPDKESPLWDPYSPVIYWWTADEKNQDYAYIVVYHGGVYAKKKTSAGSFGFRAMKKIK